MEQKITEKKVERKRYTMVCPHCKKGINGTSKSHLLSCYELHLFFCNKKRGLKNE